jgi:hypothetical protein
MLRTAVLRRPASRQRRHQRVEETMKSFSKEVCIGQAD